MLTRGWHQSHELRVRSKILSVHSDIFAIGDLLYEVSVMVGGLFVHIESDNLKKTEVAFLLGVLPQ